MPSGSAGYFTFGALGKIGLQAAGTLPYASPILAMQTQLKDIVRLTSSTVELVQQHITNRDSNFTLARKSCEAVQAVAVNLASLEQENDPSRRCERAAFVLRELHGTVSRVHDHFETLFTRYGVSRFITSAVDNRGNTRLCEELDTILRGDFLSLPSKPPGSVPLMKALEQMCQAVDYLIDSLLSCNVSKDMAAVGQS